MFKKLFKYDFRSGKRVGVPLLFGALGLTVLGIIAVLIYTSSFKTMIYMPENADESVYITTTLSMMGSGLFLVGIVVGLALLATFMEIWCFVDFYKTTVTDEAYLTFTLPVKAKDIILSKGLSTALWVLIQTVAGLGAMAIIASTGAIALGEEISTLMEEFENSGMTEIFPVFKSYIGDMAYSAVITVIYGIVSAANSIILVFTAIFFASTIMRKHRAIGAIASVVISNGIIGGLTGIISGIVNLISTIAGELLLNPYLSINVSYTVMSVVVSLIAVLLFFLLKHLMEKKLNLE